MRILIIILLLVNQNNIWACQCEHYESKELTNLEYEVNQSEWIGIGTILNVDKDSYPAIYEVQIRITYKGSNQITEIQTGLGGPDCGFVFEKDQEYIIYGVQIDDKTIETNSCTRTNKLGNSMDIDYLNKKFKDDTGILGWSESVTNFIQSKTNSQIDTTNPPILVNENYEIISIQNLIHKHPNYYTLEKLSFGSGSLKRMKPKLRNQVINNGIIACKELDSKIKTGKLIRKLNKQIK